MNVSRHAKGKNCVCWAILLAGVSVVRAGEPAPCGGPDEPTYATACRWWPEIENVWTPIGWKDHPLRFNVLYNGIIVCEPMSGPHVGRGVQMRMTTPRLRAGQSDSGLKQKHPLVQEQWDGRQGWGDGAAPLLWTEWRQNGCVIRQEVFAHLAGGGPVETGGEPLFAWVRLKIQEAPGNDRGSLSCPVRICQPHIRREMRRQANLMVEPQRARYPRELALEPANQPGARQAWMLVEPDGGVRLAVVAGDEKVQFAPASAESADAVLMLEPANRPGAAVDLLVPAVPTDRAALAAELALGFEASLTEARRYWADVPATAARIDTPEEPINEAIRRSVRFAELIARRDPASGWYSLLSGSWHYEKLWATPTSMNCTMILDTLGYHATAEKYLEVFRLEQGTAVPPGKSYSQHPGYFSSPRSLQSIDWLSDHGAILHAVCLHALLTDDQAFIDRWTPAILRACEFIRDARGMTGHGGVEGILPPAVATDMGLPFQAVWNDGWNCKGLTTAVRLLRRLRHPRAEEFAGIAKAYRAAFDAGFREAARRTPTWVDAAGREHHHVPSALPDGGNLQHPFHLDTGPLFLVYAGLMDADDELMRSCLTYFREGPNTKAYDINGAWDQPISLHHEISSCEPCYSWNVFHAHQSGDRVRFLEGMYSLFAGALSRQTFIGCEHRGGISGTLFSVPLPVYLARLAVIDDALSPDELHLLRLVPHAWVRPGRECRFENVPTEFGPVSLQFELKQGGERMEVDFQRRFRHPPQAVWLHVPPCPGLGEVVVNGRPHRVQAGEPVNLGSGKPPDVGVE